MGTGSTVKGFFAGLGIGVLLLISWLPWLYAAPPARGPVDADPSERSVLGSTGPPLGFTASLPIFPPFKSARRPSAIKIYADPMSCALNTEIRVTAVAFDQFGDLVEDGVFVNFSTGAGRLRPGRARIRNGKAVSSLKVASSGPVLLRADCGFVSASCFVYVRGSDEHELNILLDDLTKTPGRARLVGGRFIKGRGVVFTGDGKHRQALVYPLLPSSRGRLAFACRGLGGTECSGALLCLACLPYDSVSHSGTFVDLRCSAPRRSVTEWSLRVLSRRKKALKRAIGHRYLKAPLDPRREYRIVIQWKPGAFRFSLYDAAEGKALLSLPVDTATIGMVSVQKIFVGGHPTLNGISGLTVTRVELSEDSGF